MKLANVLISNLATFPYIHDIQTAPWVKFDVEEQWTIHIFIWPNWAGKSIFLDIIQQICSSVFFQPFVCNAQEVEILHSLTDKRIIHHQPLRIHNLHQNKTWQWKPSHVCITFALNEHDRANLQFIYDHQNEFNGLIKTYSSTDYTFSYTWLENYLGSYDAITCQVQIDTEKNDAIILKDNASEMEKFIYDVFQYFHLLQHCIAIHNTIKPWRENHRHVLHATFATIWSYRNLLHYNDTYTIGHEENDRLMFTLQDATVSSVKTAQDHLIGMLYVKKKIALHIYQKNINATNEQLPEILNDCETFNRLVVFSKKYLRRTFLVEVVPNVPFTYRFLLVDNEWVRYYLDDLSAGEKSMFGIVCAVYGFGLDRWLLVVDEPELHLHPQLQKQFLLLIEDLSNTYGLQCIMTTHSSLMINDKNIKHVYRFHNDRWVTRVVCPWEHYNEDASKLMQILKFTNTAKIFFVKKIIMVEWETDEFAFGNYLQYLAKQSEEWNLIIKDYEIVNINGKWWYARRKKFLNSFGIQSYFIWDWDNIQDTGNQSIDMHYYENRMRRSRGYGWYMSKSEKYKNIIKYLKSREPKHRDDIKHTIEELYKKHIFILQQWDIEAYLWMHEKWLEETVQFFQNDFATWKSNPRFDDEREELNIIFSRIFAK